MPGPLLWIALTWYLAMNVAAFAAFALDKRAARKGVWRTNERTLLGLAFCGGFIGAWTAMRVARHKTRKWVFRVLVPTFGVLHAGVWIAIAVGRNGS